YSTALSPSNPDSRTFDSTLSRRAFASSRAGCDFGTNGETGATAGAAAGGAAMVAAEGVVVSRVSAASARLSASFAMFARWPAPFNASSTVLYLPMYRPFASLRDSNAESRFAAASALGASVLTTGAGVVTGC